MLFFKFCGLNAPALILKSSAYSILYYQKVLTKFLKEPPLQNISFSFSYQLCFSTDVLLLIINITAR